MKPITRKRALRNFVASLLESEISELEMRELADELSYGNLASELGNLIRRAAELATIDDSKRNIERDKRDLGRSKHVQRTQDPRTGLALDLIGQQRLSKRRTWELMRAAGLNTERFSPDVTMKELVSRYFDSVSANDATHFLSLLGGETTDDYLRGISKRG